MEDMLFKQIEYFGIKEQRFFHIATFVLDKCPQNW